MSEVTPRVNSSTPPHHSLTENRTGIEVDRVARGDARSGWVAWTLGEEEQAKQRTEAASPPPTEASSGGEVVWKLRMGAVTAFSSAFSLLSCVLHFVCEIYVYTPLWT